MPSLVSSEVSNTLSPRAQQTPSPPPPPAIPPPYANEIRDDHTTLSSSSSKSTSTTAMWHCEYCKVVRFSTYKNAVAHEAKCRHRTDQSTTSLRHSAGILRTSPATETNTNDMCQDVALRSNDASAKKLLRNSVTNAIFKRGRSRRRSIEKAVSNVFKSKNKAAIEENQPKDWSVYSEEMDDSGHSAATDVVSGSLPGGRSVVSEGAGPRRQRSLGEVRRKSKQENCGGCRDDQSDDNWSVEDSMSVADFSTYSVTSDFSNGGSAPSKVHSVLSKGSSSVRTLMSDGRRRSRRGFSPFRRKNKGTTEEGSPDEFRNETPDDSCSLPEMEPRRSRRGFSPFRRKKEGTTAMDSPDEFQNELRDDLCSLPETKPRRSHRGLSPFRRISKEATEVDVTNNKDSCISTEKKSRRSRRGFSPFRRKNKEDGAVDLSDDFQNESTSDSRSFPEKEPHKSFDDSYTASSTTKTTLSSDSYSTIPSRESVYNTKNVRIDTDGLERREPSPEPRRGERSVTPAGLRSRASPGTVAKLLKLTKRALKKRSSDTSCSHGTATYFSKVLRQPMKDHYGAYINRASGAFRSRVGLTK